MRPRAFVEAPAGLAAVSLRLQGGPRCRPPISRIGNKAGFAHAILDAYGLRAGQGADAYVWAEADADVRGLLRVYPDAEALRRIAEILRGWADEEPRALWERLRAERKARGPVVDAEGAAGWIVAGAWAMRRGEPDSGYTESRTDTGIGAGHGDGVAAMANRCHTLATYAQIASSNRLINVAGPDLTNTGAGGTTFGGDAFATPAGETARGFEGLAEHLWISVRTYQGGASFRPPSIPATEAERRDGHDRHVHYAPDAPAAQVEALAGWLWSTAREHPGGGFVPAEQPATPRQIATKGMVRQLNWSATEPAAGVDRLVHGWPPVAVLPSIPTAGELAAMLGTPGDLDGVCVYQDPPYVGTTGYAATLGRDEVVRTALDCAAMGAHVIVSESVAVEELVAHGWYAQRIDQARRGQKRTFAKNAGEWLTMSRPPVVATVEQVGLFGGGR